MSNIDRINAAIRECLEACYESQAPLPCLAEFVTKLRADDAWRDAEVQEVETAVRQMLKALVTPAEHDSDRQTDVV
jgi:hypothetical protein